VSLAYSTAASRGEIHACGRPEMSSCSTSIPARVNHCAQGLPARGFGF
jgi:hypothetical protein